MSGFFVGVLVGAATLVVLRGLRRHRRFGGRRQWLMRWVLDRLEAAPHQEKVIREAMEELFSELREHRGELPRMRKDFGAWLRGESFEADGLNPLFARQDEAIRKLRASAAAAAARVHAALRPEQRERLAELIEEGPGHFRHHRRCCGSVALAGC